MLELHIRSSVPRSFASAGLYISCSNACYLCKGKTTAFITNNAPFYLSLKASTHAKSPLISSHGHVLVGYQRKIQTLLKSHMNPHQPHPLTPFQPSRLPHPTIQNPSPCSSSSRAIHHPPQRQCLCSPNTAILLPFVNGTSSVALPHLVHLLTTAPFFNSTLRIASIKCSLLSGELAVGEKDPGTGWGTRPRALVSVK